MTIDKFVEEEIHAKIDKSIEVSSYLVDDGKLYINSCNFKWLRLSMVVFVGENEYQVRLSDNDSYEFMILGYDNFDVSKIKLKNFYLYEGTPTDVTQVFSAKSNVTWEKLPMMWLSFSPLPVISGSVGTMSPYPYSVRMTIYLASGTDYGNRRTRQHMREVVAYLDEYADAVIKAIEFNGVFGQEFTWTKRQLPLFGRLDSKGFVKNILDGTNMSAIELELDVTTSKKCKC